MAGLSDQTDYFIKKYCRDVVIGMVSKSWPLTIYLNMFPFTQSNKKLLVYFEGVVVKEYKNYEFFIKKKV